MCLSRICLSFTFVNLTYRFLDVNPLHVFNNDPSNGFYLNIFFLCQWKLDNSIVLNQ